MAKFNAEGIDGLMLSLAEFAEIPDDVVDGILDAGANVVVKAQKRELTALGLYRTGTLENSIQGFRKVGKIFGERKRYVLIYPYGNRGYRNRKLKVKFGYATKNRAGRHYTVGGDRKVVTNNEVGFIHEFGAPRKGIQAKNWMKTANGKAEEKMVEAEAEVYDQWKKSLNL